MEGERRAHGGASVSGSRQISPLGAKPRADTAFGGGAGVTGLKLERQATASSGELARWGRERSERPHRTSEREPQRVIGRG